MSDVFCDQSEGKQTRTLGFLLLAVRRLPCCRILSVSGWSLVTRVQTPGRLLTYHPGLSLFFSRHVGWLLIQCAGLGSTALPWQPALGFKQQQHQQSVSPASLLSDSALRKAAFLQCSSSLSPTQPFTPFQWHLTSLQPSPWSCVGHACHHPLLADFSVHLGTWSCGFAPPQTPPRQRGQAERRWLWGAGLEMGEGLLFPCPSLEGSIHLGSAVEVEERSVGRPPSLGPEFASLVSGSRENTLLNVHIRQWSHPNFRHAIKSVLKMRKFHFLYPSSFLSPLLITGLFSLWVF